MQVYFKAYGIRGIRRVLKQFDEQELTEYQRDLLHHRLGILEFWRTNGKNISLTARQFQTSRSHRKLKMFLEPSISTIYRYLARTTPPVNASIRPFNGISTGERISKPICEINADLTEWLIEYNILRPHETLHMRTPAAYYFNKFYTTRLNQGVDLRLWNRTSACQNRKRNVKLKLIIM